MSSWENMGKSDEWYTPKYIFDALGVRFDLEAAAPWDRSGLFVPADDFISANSLSLKWQGFVWLNPPFEGRNAKKAWLDKMHQHGNGIVLAPDRTSAPWWQEAALKCDALMMIAGKIKFIRPDGTTGDSPSNGTTLFAYGYDAVEAIKTAESNGLGIFLKREHPSIEPDAPLNPENK